MSPKIIYFICSLVIAILLAIIYYYKDKFTVKIPTIAPANVYSSYNLAYPTDPNTDISTILQSYASNINNPATSRTNASATTTTSKSLPTALPTAGNNPQDVANYNQSQLDTITRNYFNTGIKPAIEIDNWINNLSSRLTNIQLKLVQLNVKPDKELVFY